MITRLRPYWLLGALSLAAGALAINACSSSTTTDFATDGGADASHGGHDAQGGDDATGGGLDSTTGDDSSTGDDATGGPDVTTGQDSGHDSGHEGGGGGDGGGHDGGSDGSTAGDGGGDAGSADAADALAPADCGSTPTLHVDEAGAVFCGFDFDAGADLYCTTGQECCLGGLLAPEGGTFAPQQCAAFGAACTNGFEGGLPIECGQNADCTANGHAGQVCCLKGATAPTAVAGCGYYKSTLGTSVSCETPAAGGSCAAGETQICSQQSDCPTGTTCTPMKWKLFQLGFCL